MINFTKNRQLNRLRMVKKEVQKQISEETNGMRAEEITLFQPGADGRYQKILHSTKYEGSIILDSEEGYRYLTIENRCLNQNGRHQLNQGERLLKKVNLGDVSFITTDLDEIT